MWRISSSRSSRRCFSALASTGSGSGSGSSNACGAAGHLLEKTPITAQLWERRSKIFEREEQELLAAAASSAHTNTHTHQDTHSHSLTPTDTPKSLTKTTSDSYQQIHYPFQSDDKLRALYVDPLGNLLIGKLFEDLDALAGNVALLHCDDFNPLTKRLLLVTASVDRIQQKQLLSIDSSSSSNSTSNRDKEKGKDEFTLMGSVCWVGRSSLVIGLHLFKTCEFDESYRTKPLTAASKSALSSYFTYVARDRDTGKSATINKLALSSAEEEEMFSQRQRLVDAQRSKGKESISTQHETLFKRLVEAGNVLEDMPALAHPNAVLMKATALENSLVCQPQNVNTAGRVFGGYIMHKAYDLALATSYTFAGSYPIFLECDKISFRLPVDVGDLLRLKSRVVFTSDDPIQPKVVIEVKCQVINPERASSVVSNTFSFTFGFRNGVSLRKVLPSTTEEATSLLQGSEALEITITSK